jgi:hypothetical protein
MSGARRLVSFGDPASAIGDLVQLSTASLTAVAQNQVEGAQRKRRWHRDRRNWAYVDLQDAVVDVALASTELSAVRPSLMGIIWVFGPFQRALKAFASAMHNVMKSWMRVRLYGSPQARIAAEQMIEAVRYLIAHIPTGTDTQRESQRSAFDQGQIALAEAQHDFIVAVRVDIGLDKPLRTTWWQVWRPRRGK